MASDARSSKAGGSVDIETQLDASTTAVLVRSAELRVTSGPDEGKAARIDRPTWTIGKGPHAALRLTDEKVSREHVLLTLTDQGLLLKDAGSKNGTWIGAIKVDRALITADVAVRIGATTIAITLDAQKSALQLSAATNFGEAVGTSVASRHVFMQLERAAQSDVTVLLEGESGVGKELLAQGIHAASSRAAGPFVPVDCGAIPPTLIESELFGHERGAFTGASSGRVGLFEQASGGTIFLDEIGELPIDLQPRLLRALEAREVRPVGSNRARPIDVRVVAATNKSLLEECAKGGFREDLYYRIGVARVRVPPLRERVEDIELIATRMLRAATGKSDSLIPPDLLALLTAYGWPGNVRELRNVVNRYALLGARERSDLFDRSTVASSGTSFEGASYAHLKYKDARAIVLDRLDEGYFPAVVANHDGVITHAADAAGLARSTFYKMLRRATGQIDDDDDAPADRE